MSTPIPCVWPKVDEQPYVRQMRATLIRIAIGGCERLVPPSTCRGQNGYPRAEWCDGCIAAHGLGMADDWFQLR